MVDSVMLKYLNARYFNYKMSSGDDKEYKIVNALDELMNRLSEIKTKSIRMNILY